MAEPHPDDARLMAYVDGELAADEAAAVQRIAESDVKVAARVALFERTRAALRNSPASAAPPISESLLAGVRAAAQERGTAVASRTRQARPSRTWFPAAIAASLALVVGGVLGFGLAERGRSRPALAGLVTDPQWRGALAELASGDSRDVEQGRLTAVASFRDEDGRLCREFGHRGPSGRGSVAVLCREPEGWRVAFQMAVTARSDRDYAIASSHEAVDAFLVASKAGAPLSKSEEADSLREAR